MKKYLILLFLVYQIPASMQALGPIFTFFVRQYPEPVKLPAPEKLERSAKKASLSRKIIHKLCPRTNAGIIATYGGFTAVSDFNGQLTFPRLNKDPQFTLIITPETKPIFMIGRTIHHWELIKAVPHEAFTIVRKDDPQAKLFYWLVSPDAPIKDNIIPFRNAIVLYGQPKDFFVPEGTTITSKNPNLVLPQIFVKKNRSGVDAALNFLKIRSFFSPVRTNFKESSPTTFSSVISEN